MNPPEENTWNQIQQKNLSAFEGYYKEHYKTFFLLAYKYLNNREFSQEIVNDVFLKIWEDGNQISIESSLKSYIYKAIINRCINALNKQKKEIQNQRQLEARPQETFELRQIEETELRIRLYKAIDELPEQCKKVFRMSRFEGLKQQEIADKLGISIKTVKNHITHALKELNKAVRTYMVVWILLIINLLSGNQ